MQPHRSNAMHDAAAVFTVTLGHVAVVSLSWSWSHQTQRRACAAAFGLRDTFFHPYKVNRLCEGCRRVTACPDSPPTPQAVCTLNTLPGRIPIESYIYIYIYKVILSLHEQRL